MFNSTAREGRSTSREVSPDPDGWDERPLRSDNLRRDVKSEIFFPETTGRQKITRIEQHVGKQSVNERRELGLKDRGYRAQCGFLGDPTKKYEAMDGITVGEGLRMADLSFMETMPKNQMSSRETLQPERGNVRLTPANRGVARNATFEGLKGLGVSLKSHGKPPEDPPLKSYREMSRFRNCSKGFLREQHKRTCFELLLLENEMTRQEDDSLFRMDGGESSKLFGIDSDEAAGEGKYLESFLAGFIH